jgi:hypothetical protein
MDLSYLKDLDKEALELERHRLIANAIKAAPKRCHKMLIRLQLKLNPMRDSMSSEEFIQYCLNCANENVENMCDLTVKVAHILGETPQIKPPAER